ncbi:MAG: T9SS type A sorting domain-containing protein [Chitinophagales bacterium]
MYPNPAGSSLQLNITSGIENLVQISLLDATGRRMIQTAFLLETGTNDLQLQLGALPPGAYLLRIVDVSGRVLWVEEVLHF